MSTESTNHGHGEETGIVPGLVVDELQPEHHHTASPVNQPASSPTIAGSTVVVYPREVEVDTATQTNDPISTGAAAEVSRETAPLDGIHLDTSSSTSSISPLPTPHSEPENPNASQAKTTPTSPVAASSSSPAHPHTERYIPSYEQWRKQILEKKKPSIANERKQRKRKPYQENSVDVAMGSEDELGFVFPNMDSGNGGGKNGDNRFQQMTDQLGNGPDLKLGDGKDKQWINSEYAKDPKDRFNHASATCAASVAKASKDATSIMAILNEGKDNYMLNKCSTKDKFIVVELCEEILVDTFVLGNYEFFSSTFKDFVVSVNRYPPRDDGWSILGYFQARNTRDAQVFKPAVPQLATYIRFDFLTHYGKEYYCPVTLLRVYGATALEQLKQEEEEEKRQAEEEKRLAELEKERQVAAVTEETDDVEEDEIVEIVESSSTEEATEQILANTGNIGMVTVDLPTFNPPETTAHSEVEPDSSVTHLDPTPPSEVAPDQGTPPLQEKEADDNEVHVGDMSPAPPAPDTSEVDSLTSTLQEELATTEESTHKDDYTISHPALPDSTLRSFDEKEPLAFSDHSSADILVPPASTSPASIQDETDWKNADLEMITLSPKARPTQLPRPHNPSKPSSSGVGTAPGSASSSAEPSPSPSPSPQHSTQESVYKNIVNRLKVLELNSTLSYQYLEEQSNIYNDVLESNDQRINQLVTHLNEAIRRLETLRRKYDQLAYSYRAHVEVDGEKLRQEFISLSSQVHHLGSQVMFQRHLFLVCAIMLFSIVAFIAFTGNNAMHYAIQQSPLGAKLRAISGQRNESRSNDLSSSVRIGSIEGLSQFDQSTLMLHHPSEEREVPLDQDPKLSRPISPMSPLTPAPNLVSQSRLMDNDEHSLMDFVDANPPHQNDNTNGTTLTGNDELPASRPELSPSTHHSTESPNMQHIATQFLVSRTPYPTPKNSFGPGRLFVQPSRVYSREFEPSSPVFQGPSSVHDEGQLSDADVAYMSYDMGVGRKGTVSPGSIPTSPATRKPPADYYTHMLHPHLKQPRARRLSTLRNDSTASLAALARLEPEASPNDISQSCLEEEDGMAQETKETTTHSTIRTHAVVARERFDEDAGFVSDSVLESTSESMTSSRDVMPSTGSIGDWDRHHGPGETVSRSNDGMDDSLNSQFSESRTGETSRTKSGSSSRDGTMERPRLTRDGSSKSRKSSSQNLLRSQESAASNHTKNHSASAALDLDSEDGLAAHRLEPSALSHSERRNRDEGEGDNDGVQVEDGAATAPQGPTDRRKKGKKHSQSEDRGSLRKRMSQGRVGSTDTVTAEEQGQDGDDERSPQVSRRSGY
ncbi:hypothetical protein BGX34_004751 [Mortierella sp. NVP85]|nr:hypothetical protein BGX34_004751 [Mortierella sp. NVP85]